MSTSAGDRESMKFIESISSKKIKEKYKIIEEFTNFMFPKNHEPTLVSKEIISLLLDGDFNKKLIGLCQL